jgi:DNA polymerase phi
MSKKRPRETPAVDTELVEIYEDLANDNEEIRLRATHALLKKASPESGLSPGQLQEILRRLIRGLCSGRKGARLGFSIALTELQSQLFDANSRNALSMSTADFIHLLKKETEAGGSISGQVSANLERLCGNFN